MTRTRTVNQQTLPDLPEHLSDYVELRGGPGQLIAFVALLAGVKPAMDDWIEASSLDRFLAFAHSLGLSAAVSSYFDFIDDPADNARIVGGMSLNTTQARGLPPWQAPTGAAHVFLARDDDALRQVMAFGWYPLVVHERVVHKPWIDHFHFGRLLGYPDCCRRFFAKHNDWNRENTLYQAYRRTTTPSYLCNSLLKHGGLSYTFHMPCSFDCPASIERARAVRAAVASHSRELAAYADEQLRRPYLVLSEWDAFRLDGKFWADGRVLYRTVRAVPGNRPNRRLEESLRAGDTVDVVRGIVRIHRDGSVVETYSSVSDRFGPEVPFLVDFSR